LIFFFLIEGKQGVFSASLRKRLILKNMNPAENFRMPGKSEPYLPPEREQARRDRLKRELFNEGVLKNIGTIRADTSGIASKRDGPVDMYNMSGFADAEVIQEQLFMAVRNLVDRGDFAVQEIQRELLQILGSELFGLPEDSEGLVLHSGSEANEAALYLAKRATGKRLVLASNLTHQSIARACEKLGLDIITLNGDPNFLYEIPNAELEEMLNQRGSELAAIVATAGTTQLGTSEQFVNHPAVEKFCREEGTWLHLDAAYGGTISNLISDEYPSAISPWLARSITVDAHKFVGVLGCSALLLPRKDDKQLIGPEAPYFPSRAAALGTTRSAFEPAVALATMKALGREGLKRLAHTAHERATRVANELEKAGLKMMVPIQSGVVPIELPSKEALEYMKTGLEQNGFLVSPVHIQGADYEKWGIRIVVTPKAEMTNENLSNFTSKVIELHQAMPG